MDGVDGFEAPELLNLYDLRKIMKNCGQASVKHLQSIIITTHHFCGQPAIRPTDGGDGGCKGHGGNPGEMKLFGLENASNIAVFNQRGRQFCIIYIIYIDKIY